MAIAKHTYMAFSWLALFFFCCLANGLELGDLKQSSYFEEPFIGEVPILGAEKISIDDMSVALASPIDYDSLGIPWADYDDQFISLFIEDSISGPVITISSEKPLVQPYFEFALRVTWPEGSLARGFTAFVKDKPMRLGNYASASPNNDSIENATQISISDLALNPRVGQRYQVRPLDTLWGIATLASPGGVSLQQTMLTIVALNPDAFEKANVNGLKEGFVLILPNSNQVNIDRRAAMVEVSLQNKTWISNERDDQPTQGSLSGSDPDQTVAIFSRPADKAALPTVATLSDEPDSNRNNLLFNDNAHQQTIIELESSVKYLEVNIVDLQAQLAEKEIEIDLLRTQLTESTARFEAAIRELRDSSSNFNFLYVLNIATEIFDEFATESARLVGTLSPGLREKLSDTTWGLITVLFPLVAMMTGFFIVKSLISKEEDKEEHVDSVPIGDGLQAESDAISENTNGDAISSKEKSGDEDDLVEPILAAIPPEQEISDDVLKQSKEASTKDMRAEVGSLTSEIPGSPATPATQRHHTNNFSPVYANQEDVVKWAAMRHTDRTYTASHSTDGYERIDANESQGNEPLTTEFEIDREIFGLETNPVDSQLDLARAYIEMDDGDEARPILINIMEIGDPNQQAQAQELLTRLGVS